jgi:pimeloyl-ACP methyl ester carboxylesterase
MNISLKKLLTSTVLLSSILSTSYAQAVGTEDLKGTNVVLVHGAFADGSSWNKVIPLLEARGLHVVAVQNPLSSLTDDTAATKRVIEQQDGPVILVGHSWGGAVISEAGNDEKVKALVYVAAVAPDNGQSLNDLTKGQPSPPWASQLRKDSTGYLTLSTEGITHDFAQDLPATEARLIAATQGPWFAGCLDEKVQKAAWHSKPSTFVIPNQDHMIDPRLQQAMAAGAGATVVRVDSSHVVMLSQPQVVADAIIAAAKKAQ